MLGQIFFVIDKALQLYIFAIIIYILMSWFPGARESPFGSFLSRLCEPYLEQFRRFIPPIGMIDISPLIGIFVLYFAKDSGLPALYRMLASWF